MSAGQLLYIGSHSAKKTRIQPQTRRNSESLIGLDIVQTISSSTFLTRSRVFGEQGAGGCVRGPARPGLAEGGRHPARPFCQGHGINNS